MTWDSSVGRDMYVPDGEVDDDYQADFDELRAEIIDQAVSGECRDFFAFDGEYELKLWERIPQILAENVPDMGAALRDAMRELAARYADFLLMPNGVEIDRDSLDKLREEYGVTA